MKKESEEPKRGIAFFIFLLPVIIQLIYCLIMTVRCTSRMMEYQG